MVILAHPDFWIEYIKNQNKIIPNQNYLEIFKIVMNLQNDFVYNHLWTAFFESVLSNEVNDSIDYVDVFNNIIINLHYNDRLIREDYNVIKNAVDFNNCFKKSSLINFLIVNEEKSLNNIKLERGTLIINNICKPNRNWVYSAILKSNRAEQQGLDYRDFKSNEQIQIFIQDLLNLKNPISKRFYIQSDYLNFGEIFEKVRGKSITYCTSEYSKFELKNISELQAEKISVNTYFGSNASYVVSNNRQYLHPRTIFYNNIVINIPHDFPQIMIENSNWYINLHYCPKTYLEKIRIISSYKKI
ncbi:hypothetical protein DFQ10_109113 [Winogradskyella eximia]|uniref:Uncharacterized protein n=1 Tax=Winogradskyella eximia TaxID=262006 RepID=A0A3D9H114_9FLAO|nr:hypothetical protein [Winogradskyella eximia]RED42218.1 hypothetical protein DFQ10_109113 [Winogradskyella eximia]